MEEQVEAVVNMDTVKLQCHICCSVGEIKNHFLQPADVITIVPIVELYSCKHQFCTTCVRKIAQRGRDKRVECPMCRCKNKHFNLYSVNRNVVDIIRCSVTEVREQGRFGGLVDAASLARSVFEGSMIDDEPASKTPVKLNDFQIVLKRLQTQIDTQTKSNYDLQIQATNLARANEEINDRLLKCQSDYNDACKQIEVLRCDKVKEERAIKALADKRAYWADKNAKLRSENEKLTSENISLIRDNNLFKQNCKRKLSP